MKKNRKQIIKITVFITSIFIIFMSVSFAFINLTLQGTKRQAIEAGTLSLELKEDENNLTIENALPMYDDVGMIQDAFTFRLINNGTISANYKLKLVEITTGTLSKTDVKYGLTKDGVNKIGLLSDLPSDGTIDSGTIGASPETIEYELRLWIKDTVTDNATITGKSLSYRVDLEIGQIIESNTEKITIAGVEKEVAVVEETLFNYTSEGCAMDMETGEQTCPVDATNGIYVMDDDDGPSYFYRGEVDNLVQFGEYEQDYYVYRYTASDGEIYDFTSLEACKFYKSDCSESNKVLKYSAGTPMYWRIIRINGDGTVRLIYSGTSTDALAQDTGIGLSRYNEEYNDPKYTGYTYDRTTSEVKSDAKTEIDTWYSTYLANTEYDSYIADGKFCSDSSGYDETMGMFAPMSRNFANLFGLGNASPSFKCPETEETYGESYTLKVGLITLDEMIAAGGQMATNDSFYLYNGTEGNYDGSWYWSLSPAVFSNGVAIVGCVYEDGAADYINVDNYNGLLRPVINLKAGISFQSGTDGSISTPYQIVK